MKNKKVKNNWFISMSSWQKALFATVVSVDILATGVAGHLIYDLSKDKENKEDNIDTKESIITYAPITEEMIELQVTDRDELMEEYELINSSFSKDTSCYNYALASSPVFPIKNVCTSSDIMMEVFTKNLDTPCFLDNLNIDEVEFYEEQKSKIIEEVIKEYDAYFPLSESSYIPEEFYKTCEKHTYLGNSPIEETIVIDKTEVDDSILNKVLNNQELMSSINECSTKYKIDKSLLIAVATVNLEVNGEDAFLNNPMGIGFPLKGFNSWIEQFDENDNYTSLKDTIYGEQLTRFKKECESNGIMGNVEFGAMIMQHCLDNPVEDSTLLHSVYLYFDYKSNPDKAQALTNKALNYMFRLANDSEIKLQYYMPVDERNTTTPLNERFAYRVETIVSSDIKEYLGNMYDMYARVTYNMAKENTKNMVVIK